MNMPTQSPPVLRGLSPALAAQGIDQSRCSTLKKIGCATALGACAVACYATGGLACANCLAGIGASGCLSCVR